MGLGGGVGVGGVLGGGQWYSGRPCNTPLFLTRIRALTNARRPANRNTNPQTQVRAREEELTNLASLHATTKAAADKKIADLEYKAARLQDANRQLELRRQLEADGWTADVALLRKQVAAVDRKLVQMRLIDRWGATREGGGLKGREVFVFWVYAGPIEQARGLEL
jgi:hypothetical protein